MDFYGEMPNCVDLVSLMLSSFILVVCQFQSSLLCYKSLDIVVMKRVSLSDFVGPLTLYSERILKDYANYDS